MGPPGATMHAGMGTTLAVLRFHLTASAWCMALMRTGRVACDFTGRQLTATNRMGGMLSVLVRSFQSALGRQSTPLGKERTTPSGNSCTLERTLGTVGVQP
jgi:hypothetical protein